MTVILELPPDLESEISARAAERGQAISEVSDLEWKT